MRTSSHSLLLCVLSWGSGRVVSYRSKQEAGKIRNNAVGLCMIASRYINFVNFTNVKTIDLKILIYNLRILRDVRSLGAK